MFTHRFSFWPLVLDCEQTALLNPMMAFESPFERLFEVIDYSSPPRLHGTRGTTRKGEFGRIRA